MALSKIPPAGHAQYVGARNLIINGAMQVAQRGTSATGITSGTGYNTVDRFQFVVTNAGTYTIAQSTTTPDGFGFSTKDRGSKFTSFAKGNIFCKETYFVFLCEIKQNRHIYSPY